MTLRGADLYQPKAPRSRERAENLIGLITKGDEAAFRLFHSATNGLLFAILLHILRHTQTAEDVLSQLYDEVRRKALRLSRQREKPLLWLVLIAHRLAVERLCRELTGSRPQNNSSDLSLPPNFIDISEHRRRIRMTMNSIPRSQCRIIELAFFSGLNNQEIAIYVNKPVEVVQKELRSGLLHLFSVFKALRFEPSPGELNSSANISSSVP